MHRSMLEGVVRKGIQNLCPILLFSPPNNTICPNQIKIINVDIVCGTCIYEMQTDNESVT